VLNVAADGRCLVITPEQAVWLPSTTRHSVGSLHGAEFRSLYIRDCPAVALAVGATVLAVSPLLRELVIEAAALTERNELASVYGAQVVNLIIESLGRLQPLPFSLPWPRGGALATLCEARSMRTLPTRADRRRGRARWRCRVVSWRDVASANSA
jgi:hypothetical protein